MDDKKPSKVLKIGKNLSEEVREAILEFLKRNLDVFAWAHSDMKGIDLSVMSHRLKIDPSRKTIRLKRWVMDVEHY